MLIEPLSTLRSSGRSADPGLDLAALLACLRGRGLVCRPVTTCVLGELDLRLEVGRPGTEVTVELLGPAPGAGWDAVRVRGERREVWRGPGAQDAPAERVADFACDLLTGTEHALAQRYLQLG